MTAVNTFPMPFLIDADAAARAIANGLARRQVEIVFPLPMAILMKDARLVPVRWWAALSGRGNGERVDLRRSVPTPQRHTMSDKRPMAVRFQIEVPQEVEVG